MLTHPHYKTGIWKPGVSFQSSSNATTLCTSGKAAQSLPSSQRGKTTFEAALGENGEETVYCGFLLTLTFYFFFVTFNFVFLTFIKLLSLCILITWTPIRTNCIYNIRFLWVATSTKSAVFPNECNVVQLLVSSSNCIWFFCSTHI